jgi:hypothetical protein
MAEADWNAIEDALQAWVAAASGLPGASVIWDDQIGPRPALPYATLHLEGGVTPGLFDEASWKANPDAEPTTPGVAGDGDELIFETTNQEEFTVTVGVYTDATIGPSSARAIAVKIRAGLSLESRISALDAAGIAIIDRGTVQTLNLPRDTKTEGHAVFSTRLRIVDGTSETGTFIESVDVETDITGPDDAPIEEVLGDASVAFTQGVGTTTFPASRISVVASGNLASTDAQRAFDEVQGEIDALDADLQAQIDAEIAARIAADTSDALAWAAAVAAEAATRAANDNAEATARAANDTTETNARIAADSAEATARASADTAEAAIRAANDTTITNNLNAHIAATSAHGVTGAVVGTTDTQTLSHKTFSDLVNAAGLAISGLFTTIVGGLQSLIANGLVAWVLDTAVTYTSGSLLAVRNAGNDMFRVGFGGSGTFAAGVTVGGSIATSNDNGGDIGSAGFRFSNIYLVTGVRDSSGSLRLGINSSAVNTYTARSTDIATAIAHSFRNSTAITNTSAKLASFFSDNGVTEQLFVRADGSIGKASAIVIKSDAADGTTAVACAVDTSTAWSNSAAYLLSLRTNGVEKFRVRANGTVDVGTSGITPLGSNVALKIQGRISSGSVTPTVQIGAANTLNGTDQIVGFYNDNLATKVLAVEATGKLLFDNSDSSGTPGNATINKPTGKCAVANGASAVTITNSLVTAASIVYAVIQDNTDNLAVRSVTVAAGSFTINLSGVTTGARKVGFVVFN